MKQFEINHSSLVNQGVKSLPDFMIIGEMKCGTTSLWDILDRHPQIAFPSEKELHYFDRRMELGNSWYASRFSGAGQSQICGEATPDYLFCEGACERIRDAIPTVKLVVVLRDPTARAWSHYWHNVRRGRELLSFGQAIEQEGNRIGAGDAVSRAHFAYVTRGHYIRRLRVFENAFGRDRLCVVFLEDLIANPETVIAGVCRHLGLYADRQVLVHKAPQRNRADYPRWPRVSAVTSRLMRAARYHPLIGTPASLLAKVTRPLRTYSGHGCIQPRLERSIRLGFSDSDVELEDWLGVHVPWRRR